MNWFLIFLIASFWGGSFIAIKNVVAVIDPILGAWLRIAVAAAAIIVAQVCIGKKMFLPIRHIPRVFLAGFFSLAFPFIFLFWGEMQVSAGLAGMINGTVPLWTFLLGIFFLTEEKITANKIVGIAMGIIGIMSIFYPQISFRGSGAELIGMLSIVAMACCYAVGIILTRNVLKKEGVSFHGNLLYQHLGSVILVGIFFLIFGNFPQSEQLLNKRVILSTLYLGVFSTALALFIFYYLIEKIGAVKTSVTIYIVPIMALIWDFVFFKTIPQLNQIIGIVLILSGVFVIEKKFKKQRDN